MSVGIQFNANTLATHGSSNLNADLYNRIIVMYSGFSSNVADSNARRTCPIPEPTSKNTEFLSQLVLSIIVSITFSFRPPYIVSWPAT
jgi:hypothetical protein